MIESEFHEGDIVSLGRKRGRVIKVYHSYKHRNETLVMYTIKWDDGSETTGHSSIINNLSLEDS